MKIKCYGARGSIAVSGPDFLQFGGETTCLSVTSNEGDMVVIDAGSGIRVLGNELLKSDISKVSMIFTHAHWDHLLGFPFFKPLYHDRFIIELFGCPFSNHASVKDMIAGAMLPPHFPVDINACKAKINYYQVQYSPFYIGNLHIIPIMLSHPNGGIGYKFVENKKSFVFLTDNELGYRHKDGLEFNDYVNECKNADLLIHDAEYTPEEYLAHQTWGHSSWKQVAALANEAKVKKLGLFHHNQDRLDYEVSTIVVNTQFELMNLNSNVEETFGVYSGQTITL